MTMGQREIQRKLQILRYAEEIGHVAKTCRYFGIGRTSFYRWRKDYAERGEAGLINAPPIPKRHANRTAPELEEKEKSYSRQTRCSASNRTLQAPQIRSTVATASQVQVPHRQVLF